MELARNILKHNEVQLLKILPLEDDLFLGRLGEVDLLPENSRASIRAKGTRAEKVSYFLFHVVEPAADAYLPKLLSVMEESDNVAVKRLANDMNTRLKSVSTSHSEMETAQVGTHSSQTQESDVRQVNQVVVSTGQSEMETAQVDCHPLQTQESDARQVNQVVDYAQFGIIFAFETLNGQFRKECKEHKDAAFSKSVEGYCKRYFKSDVDFSHTPMNEILETLFNMPFHNFLNVDLLKFLATHDNFNHLNESILMYESTYFSMTLNNLVRGNCRYVQKIKVKKKKKKVSERVRTKLLSTYTVYQFKDFIIKFCKNVLYIDVLKLQLDILEEGCICVEWLIPSQLADYVYHSACINTELFPELQISYLEIGRKYKIEPVKGSDGCSYKNPLQIFCEHYQFMAENMEPQLLLHEDNLQQLLLSDGELDCIQTAPIDFMKNLYIVEKVRHMEIPHLFKFLDILQGTSGHQHISDTIYNALKLAGFTKLLEDSSVISNDEETTADTLEFPGCSFYYDEEKLQSSLEKFKSKRKRLLSPTLSNKKEYFSSSSILLKYLDLFDNLAELIESLHPRTLIDAISHLVAIDTYDHCVKQFSAEYVTQLSHCSNNVEVLTKLFPYSNWCDHCVIRELLEVCNCSEGVKLLDEVDSRIDLIQPITDFPIFAPSSLIVPNDTSYYTVMAIKYKVELSSVKIYHIGTTKSEIIQMCGLTKYSCLFLAVTKHNPVVMYWLIPRNLWSSISNAVLNFADHLYSKGILEVAIYPDFVVCTSDASKVLPLEYFTFKSQTVEDSAESTVSKKGFRSYDEVVAMLKHALKQKDLYMTKLKSIENVQGYFEKALKKQLKGEDEQSICSTQESGIHSIEPIEITDKVEDWMQHTHQLESDTLVEVNELKEFEKDLLIKELQEAVNEKEVKIQNYHEEVSNQRSQIEMLKELEKDNKQLVTRIAELKVIKEGKSVAVQTDSEKGEVDVNKGNVKMLLKQNLSKAKKQHGTIPVRFLKLLFTGSTSAGKTSFINLLLKRQFNELHHNTNIVHATHAISTKTSSHGGYSNEVVWNELDSAFEIDYLHSMILPKLLTALQEPTPATNTQSLQISTEKDTASSKLVTSTHLYESLIQKESTIKQWFTRFFENPVKASSLSTFDRIINATVPDSITHQPREVLNIITLLDTGGLPEYMNLFPTINIYPTVSFIVHDLSKDLNGPVLVEFHQNSRNVLPPYHLSYSNLDMIKYLMLFANDAVQTPTLNVSEHVTTSSNNICLVGTHVDKISQQKVAQVENTLSALVNNTHCETAVWHNDKGNILFSVDNTTAGNDYAENSVANVIRYRIEEIASEQDIDELPITWMLLELEILHTCFMRKIDYISFHDCVVLARETGLMSSKEEIKNVLLYHHHLGVLTYFDEVPSLCDYVIVGHQWWFNILSNIICITFQEPSLDHHAVQKFKNQGLLSKELLQHIKWKDDLKEEFFLSLLVHMKISVPVLIDSEGTKEYFIPYILPAHSFQQSNKVLDQYGYLQGDCLIVNFQTGLLPKGFFCSLIIELLQYPPKKWQPHFFHKGVYHTFSNFFTFQMHKGYSLSLMDKESYLEVQIRHSVRDYVIPIHNEVYNYLVYALKDVCIRLFCDYKMLQYGFICQCGKDIKSHIAVVPDSYPLHYAQCSMDKKCLFKLSTSHLAWFLSETSDTPSVASDTNTTIDQSEIFSQSRIFSQRPKFFDIARIVIPKVMNHWEYIAEALYYDIIIIEAIYQKGKGDPKHCCREFFKDWLVTNNGAEAGPKVWSTLLIALQTTDEISSDITEDIIAKIKQLK